MSKALEGHTVQRYDGELNHLHMQVVKMASLALDQTKRALYAFHNKDITTANLVIEREQQVDGLELAVDEEVIATIARRAPVARDLRVIMSFSKAVTDLERIGDESAKISHLSKAIFDNEGSDPSTHILRDVTSMGAIVLSMLQEAIEIFDQLDVTRAEILAKNHNGLDIEFQSSLRRLTTFVLEDARNVGHTISIVLILKALERIGEHARNLAEYVIYLVNGVDIRHPESQASKE